MTPVLQAPPGLWPQRHPLISNPSPRAWLAETPPSETPNPRPLKLRPFRRLIKASAALAVTLALLWLARAPILRTAAHLWIVEDTPEPAQAIVILGGGEDYRPFAAARLWKAGLAPVILVPNVEVSPTESLGLRPSTTDVILGVLKAEGIPDHAIHRIGQNLSSTREETLAVQTWLQSQLASDGKPETQNQELPLQSSTFKVQGSTLTLQNPLPRALLIPTDPFATRRTKAYFQKILPGHPIRIIRTNPKGLDSDHWWTQESGLIAFQNEVIKWLFYKVKY